MRFILLIAVVFASATLAIWPFSPDFDSEYPSNSERLLTNSVGKMPEGQARSELSDQIVELERYEDLDYGFSVAVPVGWTKIVAADTDTADSELASLEPGYAVGFGSPRSNVDDRFEDYILIEVLPGDDSGLFEASDAEQRFIQAGSEKIAYDRLEVDGATDDASDIDLVIFQRGVKAFGYTLGFYAIGEPSNEQAMFDAFQIMLRTYKQKADPFVII
ncbi:MAG: hypothetical protein AB8B87_14250 [Granulosicoccus sp.]